MTFCVIIVPLGQKGEVTDIGLRTLFYAFPETENIFRGSVRLGTTKYFTCFSKNQDVELLRLMSKVQGYQLVLTW